jgi:hypothetical protein
MTKRDLYRRQIEWVAVLMFLGVFWTAFFTALALAVLL